MKDDVQRLELEEGTSVWSKAPHPFVVLLAIATVTVLLAANRYEGVRAVNLLQPLAVALSLALLTWAISASLTSDRLRRSLAAVAVSLPAMLSGYLFGWLRTADYSVSIRAGGELVLLVLAIAGAVWLIVHIRWSGTAARFLNLFSTFIVILTLPAVVGAVIEPDETTHSDAALPDTSGLVRPDIYLLVLDAYTGTESLERIYGFDNSAFLDALVARGFAIPERPRSNYIKTFLTLGSMLNRRYFDELLPPATVRGRDRDGLYNRMEFNQTILDMKKLGYEFYYVGSSYPPLASNRLADLQYSRRPSREFEKLWLRTTALPPILQLCALWGFCSVRSVPFNPESASGTEARIEYLAGLIPRHERKFVFAHWLLPHGPFRFDARCGHRPPRWTVGVNAIESDSLLRRLYVDQLQCTNQKILEAVDRIRREGPRDAVIILQADHGYGRFVADKPTDLALATGEQIRERFDIFAAYAGPGFLGDSLAAHRTPVNVFRTLFRVLWGVDEPPLDDRFYWSDGSASLHLREVYLE